MKALSTIFITVYILIIHCQLAVASSPTPTPHGGQEHDTAEQADMPLSAATLNAELREPLGHPRKQEPNRPLVDMDHGSLDDMGSVGGDFEE